jgi:hypothetical protein
MKLSQKIHNLYAKYAIILFFFFQYCLIFCFFQFLPTLFLNASTINCIVLQISHNSNVKIQENAHAAAFCPTQPYRVQYYIKRSGSLNFYLFFLSCFSFSFLLFCKKKYCQNDV